ncbi:MAG: glycosyltransferase [Gammaproteobacteria bacterium]|nr:glycosyltransferase [Gammaproteobacteria bacterium]
MSNVHPLHFAVFSFNRGIFLEHCISSLVACVDNPTITIYDDNSTDGETLNALDRLSSHHRVVQPKISANSKHGGLSANMQLATEECTDPVNLCYVQDDMQMVRRLSNSDLQSIDDCLEDPTTAFVHPVFMKGWNRKKDLERTEYQAATHSYTRRPDKAGAGIFFADVMIARPYQLKQAKWTFSSREKTNELLARQLFGPMQFLFSPFLMWLPSVPTYRGKQSTLALRIGEKRHQCGFHPIDMMSDSHIEALKTRNKDQLPVAEDWLTLSNQTLPDPWVYEPMHGSRSLKWLNRLELTIRKR